MHTPSTHFLFCVQKMNLAYLVLLVFLNIKLSHQDIYLHNPRGSNNRLNEKSAARTNANRLFDSQNNNRGGYNVGDLTSTEAQSELEQYQMKYFQSGVAGKTFLNLEWTQQHGCGGNEDTNPHKINCILVVQSLCQDIKNTNDLDRLRDGVNTQTQDYTNLIDESIDRKSKDVKLDRGLHESWEWYDKCNYRDRNKGLFVADQVLRNNNKGYSSAVYTRQNPNGNRRGYECPEERDYYPYFYPTPWTDIAILTNNITLCDTQFKGKSFNVKSYYECVETSNGNLRKSWSRWNNENDCLKNNGKWIEFFSYIEKLSITNQRDCEVKGFKWALPYDAQDITKKECLVQAKEPICKQADWTRTNHLGNTADGSPINFIWQLPYFPSQTPKKCIIRVRYNISTDDFDPFLTDYRLNGQNSPVKENPLIDVGVKNRPLRLAIDTAQYGRVFQDRSHTFTLLPRSNNVIQDSANIYNLNVRGKRGNIVQVYPAVEYDFVPNDINLSTNDILHIQWTGSNSHLNGAPGGDGQTGNDGNGKAGTDRSNFVELRDLNTNYPLPFELTSIWNDIDINQVRILNGDLNPNDQSTYFYTFKPNQQDLALYFASNGYYKCIKADICGNLSYDNRTNLDSDLNLAPASFPGALVRFSKSNKVHYYMSSRNNNFSNRSQKGKISVN